MSLYHQVAVVCMSHLLSFIVIKSLAKTIKKKLKKKGVPMLKEILQSTAIVELSVSLLNFIKLVFLLMN